MMKVIKHLFLALFFLGNLQAEGFHKILRERRIGYPLDAFPLFTERADKLLAKHYASSHELDVLKIPKVYYQTKDPRSIPFKRLSTQFAIKANHGSNMNIFCVDQNSFDKTHAILLCYKYLNKAHGERSGENWYLGIDREIFVEEFFDIDFDLKFHCIHGKVAFIECHLREQKKFAYFTIDWNRLGIKEGSCWTQLSQKEIPPQPTHLKSLISDCEQLAQEFDYVRVDTFISGNHYYFCEFTFAPDALKEGMRFYPLDFGHVSGEMLLNEKVDYDKIDEYRT